MRFTTCTPGSGIYRSVGDVERPVLLTSLLAWIAGGAAGAALSKKHRIAGFALGAFVVGVFADSVIEKRR